MSVSLSEVSPPDDRISIVLVVSEVVFGRYDGIVDWQSNLFCPSVCNWCWRQFSRKVVFPCFLVSSVRFSFELEKYGRRIVVYHGGCGGGVGKISAVGGGVLLTFESLHCNQ